MKKPSPAQGSRCISCNKTFSIRPFRYVCDSCGSNLELFYDYDMIRDQLRKHPYSENPDHSMWRYGAFLPVQYSKAGPSVHIGWTPLYRSERLEKRFGLRGVFIKDEGRNPSASTKDRAGAVVIAHALQMGERTITCASTGNAGSSLACLAASCRMRTVIFVPAAAPRAKIAQLLVYDAGVIPVDGSYDDAYDLCLAASKEYGWYNRNTGYNPYTREGKKTVSFEICEQLGWKCPDAVLVAVGDGNLISGVWKGFCDLYETGMIDKPPRLVACQAKNSAAVKMAFEGDGKILPVSGETVADSIAVKLPRDGKAAVNAIRESGGFAVSVPDEQIINAMHECARETGVFGEPAGVTPFAALEGAVSEKKFSERDTVVVVVSGNGLKDIDAALGSLPMPPPISPTIDELEKFLAERFQQD
jgi:threonine synthase